MALQVTVAAGSEDEAKRLATDAVEARLAACAQVIGPVASVYVWQGVFETSQEWLCLLKTTEAALATLVASLESWHSYDTPEIIATPIVGGSPRYLSWLTEALGAQ